MKNSYLACLLCLALPTWATAQEQPATPTNADDSATAPTEETAAPAAEPAETSTASSDEEDAPANTAGRLASANPTSGLPWSLPITATNTLTTSSFRRASMPTYDPFYQLNITAVPRWNFNDALSIGLTIGGSVEFTDANDSLAVGDGNTDKNRQWTFSDTRLDLTYTLPVNPLGTSIITQGAIFFPTSNASQGSSRYFAPSAAVVLIRPFPVLEGLILSGSARFTGWFAGAREATSSLDSERCWSATTGDSSASAAISGVRDCGAGASSGAYTISTAASVTLLPIPKLALSLSYMGMWNRGFTQTGDSCVNTLSGNVCVDDESATHWRPMGNFGASVSYDLTSYLTASLSYGTFSMWPDSDGGFENPIFNENSTLAFSLQFRPDGLVTEIQGHSAAAAE